MPRTTGLDLKLERVAQRVKQAQIASRMGVTESRVSSIEREGVVTPETAARYREALAYAAQAHGGAA